MPDAATYAIELLVGVACLGVAVGMRRRPGVRALQVLLATAGVAAVVHAAVELV